LLLAAFLSLSYYSYSNAQVTTNPTQTSPDLLEPDASKWSGTFGTGYWGGSQTPQGPGNDQDPNMLPSGTGFVWGGNNSILSTTIAINQALQVAGIQVNGFEYEWKVKNGNANLFAGQPGVDDFVIEVDIYDAQGNLYATYQYDYSYSHNWTTHSGQELFTDPFLPPSYFGSVDISAQGSDSANWQGWYGPEFNVQDSSFSVIFSTNPCHNNPLYDPQCQGYAQALFNQQCTANPLYDPACPGYSTANFTQQCTANPLYDPACPGYQTAYYNQQCTNDPTSDPGCPDYYVAMCEEDPLFDPGCTGYDVAYFNQQCSLDPQYDVTCPGYVDLSGNDGEFTVLSPVIDDVVNADPVEPEIYEAPVETLPQEELIVDQEQAEADSGFQMVEDDIEEELGELEMVDDIDAELAKLEDESGGEGEGSEAGVGNTNQEDDIEKELAELEKTKPMDEQPAPGKAPPPVDPEDSRRDKMRMLIAMKAIEAVKELESAVTLEQQMEIQRRLLALISFVPDFKTYAEKEQINQVNFYPPKPTVDHAFARWFLNDPNFGAMEDLQYQ
jgi:hypothetical protein